MEFLPQGWRAQAEAIERAMPAPLAFDSPSEGQPLVRRGSCAVVAWPTTPKICVPGETLFSRKHLLECRVACGNGGQASTSAANALRTEGDLRQLKESLLTCFEVVAYGGLLLILPCVLVGLVFDCMLTEILTSVTLVAVVGTAVLTAIAIHEGWYFEHSSGWGFTRHRVEPGLGAGPPSAHEANDGEAR
jgi:hypothetical protein